MFLPSSSITNTSTEGELKIMYGDDEDRLMEKVSSGSFTRSSVSLTLTQRRLSQGAKVNFSSTAT